MTELPPGAGPLHTIAPGTTLREWRVVRFVGRGSYGMVFEAERSSWLHEPHRALKVFDPIVSGAARSALLAEFGALTGVRHPHLLAGIDAFDLTEPPYAGCVVFVLELADEDLSHRIARAGRLPPGEVAAIGAQVADGLTALHGAGRIHGDVKPENILRVGDRWALGDFGVTGLLEGSYAVTTGATIDYRPPELAAAAEGTRLHRSADVWALGVTLHVAATGQHPFRGPDPIMRYAAAVRGDRLPAPAVDPALAAVVDGACLAADPAARADAPTLADHLRLWPAVPPSLSPPPPPAPQPMAPPPVVPPAPPTLVGAPPVMGPAAQPPPDLGQVRSSTDQVRPTFGAAALALALATLVVTQVVAVAAGGLVDGLGARRAAYAAVSLALVAGLVAGAVALAGRRGRAGALRPPVAAAVAGATWLAATVVLFLR